MLNNYFKTMDDRESIKDFFSKDGILSRYFENYEFRDSQSKMALEIYDTLEERRHLAVEAPTGIGKSFAYLVPSIYFAIRNKKKAIISTHTINLQEQLVHKDIPLLKEILPLNFKATLLKGKNNYICPNRLKKALNNSNTLFEKEETIILDRIYNWFMNTKDGTLSDINFPINYNVWNEVCAEVGICTGKTCGNPDTTLCFYQKAKQKTAESDLIILNHHLFFTLFNTIQGTKDSGYLFANDFVIFDESHTLESVAAEHMYPSLSREMIKYQLNKLYNKEKKKGFLLSFPALHIHNIIFNLTELTNLFFRNIREKAFGNNFRNRKKLTIRVTEKNITPNILEEEIHNLLTKLRELRKFCRTEIDENELNDYIIKFGEFNSIINSFLNQDENDIVYWIELSSEKENSNARLCKSPIDLRNFFKDNIFGKRGSVITTSATMTINGNFDYFKNRLGADDVNTLILPTQFDFERQVKLYIPRDSALTPHKEISTEYINRLNYWIKHFVKLTNGKALILFTSMSLMTECYNKSGRELENEGFEILVQNSGVSRKKLLEDFRNKIDSVLYGLDSFWLGVDIQGEALSNLIITRLPFQTPDHPLIQARLEYIDINGGNSFMDYLLPEAVLKFRQGFGRLIRHREDTGIVVILDNRILTKSYGRIFINSIEKCNIEII